jgi:hypothetical protein
VNYEIASSEIFEKISVAGRIWGLQRNPLLQQPVPPQTARYLDPEIHAMPSKDSRIATLFAIALFVFVGIPLRALKGNIAVLSEFSHRAFHLNISEESGQD